jgi:hypothetical protein
MLFFNIVIIDDLPRVRAWTILASIITHGLAAQTFAAPPN